MKQRYMVIDVRWCQDCNNCFMSCKDEHVGNDWAGYTDAQPRHGHRWMNIQRRERGTYARNDFMYLPMPCQHCENAPCVNASNGAITQREDGIVMIDMEKAKGNKALVDACPYGAIYWNEEVDKPQKCTMCAHLLDDADWAPAKPRCAHSCPTEAIKYFYVEPEEMAKMVAEEGLEVYKPEFGTNPRVYYKNLFKFTKNFIAGGCLIDGDCYEGGTAVLSLDGKEIATQTTNFFGDYKFDGLEDGEYTIAFDCGGKTKEVKATVAGKSLNLGNMEI